MLYASALLVAYSAEANACCSTTELLWNNRSVSELINFVFQCLDALLVQRHKKYNITFLVDCQLHFLFSCKMFKRNNQGFINLTWESFFVNIFSFYYIKK